MLAGLLLALAGLGGHSQGAGTELVVGSEVDFPPFALGQPDAEPSGFTVELWQAVAQQTGLRYRYRVRPFAELLQEFREGRIDVLINLAQSPQRAQFAAFSVPHVVTHGALFVRRGSPPHESEQALRDRSIIVIASDLAEDHARASGYRQLVPVRDVAQGMRLLAAGPHDGMLVSRLVGLQTIKELGLRDIEPVSPPVHGIEQRFSFAVARDRPELLALINEGLAGVRASGRFEQIHETWLAPLDPRPPTAAELLQFLWPAALLLLVLSALLLAQRRVIQARTRAEDQQRDQRLVLERIV
ncbi:MAG TPA: transporter substrate-binding domain-containing protein, partial [Rubrivivax sp.]|nr:transporter substrate-binding domain-containing protein [Rubrivivax sp.]